MSFAPGKPLRVLSTQLYVMEAPTQRLPPISGIRPPQEILQLWNLTGIGIEQRGATHITAAGPAEGAVHKASRGALLG